MLLRTAAGTIDTDGGERTGGNNDNDGWDFPS
jgi:hypothetical protein